MTAFTAVAITLAGAAITADAFALLFTDNRPSNHTSDNGNGNDKNKNVYRLHAFTFFLRLFHVTMPTVTAAATAAQMNTVQ